MRWLIKTVLTLLSLLTLGVITILLTINSEVGTQIGYQIAKYSIPGKLSVRHIDGKLASNINIRKLHYSIDGKDILIDKINLHWRPLTLFKHHLKIKSVVAQNITIQTSPKDQPLPSFNLTLVGDGSLDHYQFNLKLSNENTHWHGILEGNDHSIEFKTIDSRLLDGNLELNGRVDWRDTVKIPNLFAHLELKDGDILVKGNMAENWAAELQKLNIKSKKYGHYLLEKPTKLTLNPEHIEAKNLCFKTENAHLICMGGDWYAANHFNIHADAANILIEQLHRFLQRDDFHAKGLVTAKMSLQQAPTTPFHARAKLDFAPGSVEYATSVESHRLKYDNGTVNVDVGPSGTSASLEVNLVNNSHLKGNVSINKLKSFNDFSPKLAMHGKINWNMDDIDFIQALLPDIDNLKGKINTQINIAGTIADPKITGTGQITDASFEVPSLQSRAHELTLHAKTAGNKIDFEATAKAGTGSLQVDGNTDLASDNFRTLINIKGENALLINLSQAKVYATPDVKLQLDSNGLDVQGDINIPSGDIRSYQFADTESLPDDVVIIDPKTKKPQDDSNFTITSNINLILGKNINIEVEGLKAKLTGQMTIKDEPQKPTTASGQLSIVDGSFELYGTTFSITRGKLNYHGGPISNPGLNIKAIRSFDSLNTGTDHLGAEKVIFGVLITGTANKPQYQLFSEPGTYSQADILAYLFTGQPLSQAGESQGKLLLQAASLVNIGGKGKLSNLRNEIKDTLGLSLLDIETTSDIDKKANRSIQHTALVLGKYLSPKLYLRYSFDILDHSNKLNIRYILNKNWSIQTESTTSTTGNTFDNGVDVLYSIERD